MNIIFVLYFVINLFFLPLCVANKTGDVPTYRELCPYNKFCQSAPLKIINEEKYVPCCQECSCEIDCFETGSCCPDMTLSADNDQNYPCRHLWHYGKGFKDSSDKPEYWYHMIDDCPYEIYNSNVTYHRCKNPSQIQDFVVVTDIETGRVYKNKHCAECHNVKNYSMFELQMNCNDYSFTKKLSSDEERYQYAMEKCTLFSLPPKKHLGLSKCVPESQVIAKCNITGSWDIYNKEIERLCTENKYQEKNTIFTKYVYTSRIPVRYFANVYCFLCNVKSSEPKVDTCSITSDTFGGKSSKVPFFAILNTKMWGDELVHKRNFRCPSSHIFDPFRKICRKLFCPHGHIPVDGKCEGLYSNIYGFKIAIHFEVTFNYQNITDYKLIVRILENRFIRELGNDIRCGICSSDLFSGKDSTSKLFFRFEMFAKEGCQYNVVLERLRSMAIRKIMYQKIKYRNKDVRLQMTLIFEETYYTTGFNHLAGFLTLFCSSPFTKIDESILSYCPAISLPRDEVYKLQLHYPSVFHQVNVSNATFQQVCIDEYFSAHQDKSLAEAHACIVSNIYMILSMLFVTNCVL